MIDVGSQVGDYEVLEKLGAGGVGRVYKVRHRITGRIEALKVLLPHRSLDEQSRDRFLREARVQANLQHPNIASVLTAFDSEDGLVLVMEFIAGEPLSQYLERGRLPLDEQLRYATQALSGLAYAHSRGVIHRDIKPENLLIGPSKTLKLTDFGLAKTVTDIQLTATGTPMGSVYYLSPEQVTQGDAVDHRADIYSMGAVLYQLAAGRRPFRGSQAYELMRAHLEEQPVPPADVDASVPAELSRVILRAMSKDPNDRFASADEFSFELSLALRKPPARISAPVELAAPKAVSPSALLADRSLVRFLALIAVVSFAALFVASRWRPAAPTRQTAMEQESPLESPPPAEPTAETVSSALPAAERERSKPSPVQAEEAEPPQADQPVVPSSSVTAILPVVVQVRILNAFGSDSAAGGISAEIINPPAFAGYHIDGRVIEAKSSGKEDGESNLKVAFTVLQGAGQAVPIESEIQGFRNSQGIAGADEDGKELKMKGGVLKRGKRVARGIGSAVGGLFGRKGNRDRPPAAATLTAKAARISFLPGSEFDLYVTELDSD
jgi:serine/threonine-protein kinase